MSHLIGMIRRYTATMDGKTAGAVDLFTTVKAIHPLAIRTKLTVVSGLVSVCTLSIGTNAATYNNLILAVALTGLTTVGSYLQLTPVSPVLVIPAGTLVRANVTVVAVGTTYTLETALLGDE
jgi:hypothetical protein